MFVILNVEFVQKGRIKRGKTVSRINEVMTGGGERFYIADIAACEKGINWDEVEYFLGRYGKNILLDNRIKLPDFTGLRRFSSDEFKNILLFNTVSSLFKRMYLEGVKISCCIHDSEGLYSSFLPLIVKFASETVVVTKRSFRYHSEISRLYSYMGAGVRITDKEFDVQEGAFVIDTDNSFKYRGKGLVFSPWGNGLNPYGAEGFNDIKSLCPEYIDITDFLGAMYKLNRENRLKDALCGQFKQGGNIRSASDVYEEMKSRAEKSLRRKESIIFYV